MAALANEQLKKIVLQEGLLTEQQFEAIVENSKRLAQDPLDVLVTRKIVTQDFIADELAKVYKTEVIKLKGSAISKNVLSLIPEAAVYKRKVVAFDLKNGVLHVAMINPADFEAVNYVTKLTGRQIKIFVTTPDEFNWILAEYRRMLVETYNQQLQSSIAVVSRLRQLNPEKAAQDVSVVALLDNLFKYAASIRASDVHIEILNDIVLVRFRVDGVLHEMLRMPKNLHQPLLARIKILGELRIDEHFRAQDGRLRYQMDDLKFDIRISIMPTLYGEKIVMRILESSARAVSLEELGMNAAMSELMRKNLKKTFGILLVTGPTGSGKTTTLYSSLSYLNRPEVNIVTVEDPIEYEMPYINQTQVNVPADITFANALRSFLRQDPNIIMVGEIRDEETAAIAVHAALTGHLVLSTLHTNDAITAIPRMLDMKVPSYLLVSSLNGALAQRLVRKICSNCLESYESPEEAIQSLKDQFVISTGLDPKELKIPSLFFRGKGCETCNNSGYSGRVGLYEFLNIDGDIRELIQSSGFSLEKATNLARKKGFRSMLEDGIEKLGLGLTTLDEILRVIRE